MKQGGGEPAHEVLRFEPEVFVPHGPPEPHDHLAVELARSTGQGIHLLGVPDLQSMDGVQARHTLVSDASLPWFFQPSSVARSDRFAIADGLQHVGLRA